MDESPMPDAATESDPPPSAPPETPSATGSGPAVPPENDSPLRAIGTATGLGILGPVLLIVIGIPLTFANFLIVGLSEAVFLVVATTIGQWVGFAGLGVGYLQARKFEWADIRSYFGVRVPSLKELGVVVGGWLLIFGLIIVLSLIVSLFLPEPASNEGAETAMANPAIIPAMIVMMFLVVGPCEEILYRGVVQGRLRETLSPAPAIVIASGVFALIHVIALGGGGLTGRLVTVGILFFPALVFGIVYEYTGNLVVPALLHSIHNSVLLTLLYLSVVYGGELEESAASALVTGASILPL